MRQKLLFFVTEDWYFCLHWMDLARAARDAGDEIVVLTRVRDHANTIKEQGFELIPIEIRRSTANPLSCAIELFKTARAYAITKPDLAHHIALKPTLYGTLTCLLFRRQQKIINILPGLGHLFVADTSWAKLLRTVVTPLFKLVFRYRRSVVVTQNRDDRSLLQDYGWLGSANARVVSGVGVDLERFSAHPEETGPPVILLAGRLLWDKGLREFAEAARQLRGEGVHARFVLAGAPDPDNPSSVSEAQLMQWQTEGILEWWGKCLNMPDVYRMSHIVCLPSYREGMPTALLEAAACGRAVISTDVAGCRDAVVHGVNGLLVPPRDPKALAHSLKQLAENAGLRRKMGEAGRNIVEERFSRNKINKEMRMLREYLLQSQSPT